jgi:hypothetical protein
MDLGKLQTLKRMLTTAREFSSVFAYFLDHFGESPEFIALGERTDSPFLETVLAEIGKELFGKEVQVQDVLLTRLAEQGFIHGACSLGGTLANVLYFEDVRMGLLVVVLSFDTNETRLVRFSGRPLTGAPVPSAN